MASKLPDFLPDQCRDIRSFFLRVKQIAHILFSGQSDHYHQPMPLRAIQQRDWRSPVGNPNCVDAMGCHLGKITLNFGKVVVLIVRFIRLECPVGHSFAHKLGISNVDELARNAGTNHRGCIHVEGGVGIGLFTQYQGWEGLSLEFR